MKKIFLLLFFLFPYSKTRFNMQEIYAYPFSYKAKRLRTDTINDHFFIGVSYPYNNSQYVYFYLSDISYGLRNISCCLTKENPDSGLYTCNFNDIKAYNTKNSGNEKQYFYKVDIDGSPKTKQYVIVKYSGSYTSGSKLFAMCTYNDIYDLFYKELNRLNIAFIIIGTAIIVSIVLYVIFYFCRRKIEIDYTIYSPFQLYGSSSTPSYPLYS